MTNNPWLADITGMVGLAAIGGPASKALGAGGGVPRTLMAEALQNGLQRREGELNWQNQLDPLGRLQDAATGAGMAGLGEAAPVLSKLGLARNNDGERFLKGYVKYDPANVQPPTLEEVLHYVPEHHVMSEADLAFLKSKTTGLPSTDPYYVQFGTGHLWSPGPTGKPLENAASHSFEHSLEFDFNPMKEGYINPGYIRKAHEFRVNLPKDIYYKYDPKTGITRYMQLNEDGFHTIGAYHEDTTPRSFFKTEKDLRYINSQPGIANDRLKEVMEKWYKKSK